MKEAKCRIELPNATSKIFFSGDSTFLRSEEIGTPKYRDDGTRQLDQKRRHKGCEITFSYNYNIRDSK